MDQILDHKKGCQKHYKDELIAEGWTLERCKDVFPERNDSAPCFYRHPDDYATPDEETIDDYEMWKEAVFHACETTIGQHNDELASELAELLQDGGDKRAAVRSACIKKAKC